MEVVWTEQVVAMTQLLVMVVASEQQLRPFSTYLMCVYSFSSRSSAPPAQLNACITFQFTKYQMTNCCMQ